MLLRIGHRGARGHAPENTLQGLEKGIALHAHLLEFDVRRTRDGHLVLLHDTRVDRTTNGRGLVRQLSLAEVRALVVKGDQRIPLLEEALTLLSGRAGAMIELKDEGTAHDLVRTVQRSQFSGPIVYASFLHDELVAIRRVDTQAHTLALIEAIPVNRTAFATDALATHVGVAFESLTPSFLSALHGKGLRVFVYTVNEPDEIQAAKAMGVDGIISDFPDRLV